LVPLIVRWPIISAFGAYVLLIPFDSVAVVGTGGTLTKIVGILAAAVLLGAGLIERRIIRPPAGAICWALFLLWAIVSSPWAIDPGSALSQTILGLFLLYFIPVSMRVSRKELMWIAVLIVFGSALAAGASVLYGIEGAYSHSVRQGARSSLTVGEYTAGLNMFAASLISPLSLAMGGFVGFRSWIGRLFSVIAVGAISAAIYLTMSRGALLGVVVMAAVFLIRFRLRWQVLVAGCLLIGVAAIMPATFLNRILSTGSTDTTGTGRTEIWEVGIKALQTYGLVGAGLRSFPEAYARTVPLNPSQDGRASHNEYLAIFVELGVVGLMLLLAAIACQLWAARRARNSDPAIFVVRSVEAACYGLLATAFFSNILWTKFFWLPWILLAWGVQQRDSSEPRMRGAVASAEDPVTTGR
jgi:O-antigen ligase